MIAEINNQSKPYDLLSLIRKGKRCEANSQDLSNRRKTHMVKPSMMYNNMTKEEFEYSSKYNSRNLSNRNHAVYMTSGRSQANNSYQGKNLQLTRSAQRKKNSCAMKKSDVDKIFVNMK